MEEKGQVQEILCGKIGHDSLMAKEKKGKSKDNFVSCGHRPPGRGMGREGGGGFWMGNTCKPMADSYQCMAKPTTIL